MQFTPMKLTIANNSTQTVKVPWVKSFGEAQTQVALLINDLSGSYPAGLYLNVPGKGWQILMLNDDFFGLQDTNTFQVYYLTQTPVAQGSGTVLYSNGTKTVATSVAADNNLWIAAIPNGLSVASSGNLVANGGIVALTEVAPVVTLTATGLAFTGVCEYGGLNIRAVSGTVNIVVYDNTSATGTPIHTENNVTLGGKPWMGAGTTARRANTAGLYLSISGGGTVTVDALVN